MIKIKLSDRRINYLLSFLIQVIFAALFVDRQDFETFTSTGYDIFIIHSPIYGSNSLHNKFRYFPLAYLAVLPGQGLYYALHFNNIRLQRVFLKLPLLFGDLWLASMFKPHNNGVNDDTDMPQKHSISPIEIFILFNPVLIYAGPIKGQFDIIPGILLLYSWRYHIKRQYVVSGFFSGAAFMFKQYCIIFSYYLFIIILVRSISSAIRHSIGFLMITVPTILLALLINQDAFLERAIFYHLYRTPDGYSIPGIFLKFLKFHNLADTTHLYPVINTIGTIILVFIVLRFTFKLIKNQSDDVLVIIRFFLMTFVWFLCLKIFLIHYLAGVIPLWTEYTKEREIDFIQLRNQWSISLIPLSISMRVKQMTPTDTQQIFGNYWFYWIWILGIIGHLALVSYFIIRKVQLYPRRRFYQIHGLLLIGLSIQLFYI